MAAASKWSDKTFAEEMGISDEAYEMILTELCELLRYVLIMTFCYTCP